MDTPSTGRLFRHDRQIIINTARTTFAGWHDRLIAATLLLAGLAVIRSWVADRAWTTAASAAVGVGLVAGIGAGRLVAGRLLFHGFDGLLAADALHGAIRRRYRLHWMGLGLAMLATVTAIARPAMVMMALPAYTTGGSLATLISGVRAAERLTGWTRRGWQAGAWLRTPRAGVGAALLLLLSLLPARTMGNGAPMALAGIEAAVLALALTAIDHNVIRFMTIAGHAVPRIVAWHGASLAGFVAVAVPAGWLMLGPAVAGMVAIASLAVLLFAILRILLYRLHGKRIADFLVSLCAGLLIATTIAMPIASPALVILLLWRLNRRGNAVAWALA